MLKLGEEHVPEHGLGVAQPVRERRDRGCLPAGLVGGDVLGDEGGERQVGPLSGPAAELRPDHVLVVAARLRLRAEAGLAAAHSSLS